MSSTVSDSGTFGELRVDDICVTRDQLRAIVEGSVLGESNAADAPCQIEAGTGAPAAHVSTVGDEPANADTATMTTTEGSSTADNFSPSPTDEERAAGAPAHGDEEEAPASLPASGLSDTDNASTTPTLDSSPASDPAASTTPATSDEPILAAEEEAEPQAPGSQPAIEEPAPEPVTEPTAAAEYSRARPRRPPIFVSSPPSEMRDLPIQNP